MGLRNKLRNLQMFGFFKLSPQSYKKLFLGVLVIALFIFIGKFYLNQNNAAETLTGEVITSATEDTTLQNPQQETTEQETQNQEPLIEEAPPEPPKYYEYGGQCSYDIEKAEDDITDIQSYMKEDEQKYKTLKEEYDRKLQELKEQYEYGVEVAREQTELNQKALEEAQTKLTNLQQTCAF